jgi:hypothetical protein
LGKDVAELMTWGARKLAWYRAWYQVEPWGLPDAVLAGMGKPKEPPLPEDVEAKAHQWLMASKIGVVRK